MAETANPNWQKSNLALGTGGRTTTTLCMVLGILGSGSGSNLQALLDAIDAGHLAARIALVLSDNPDAFILDFDPAAVSAAAAFAAALSMFEPKKGLF